MKRLVVKVCELLGTADEVEEALNSPNCDTFDVEIPDNLPENLIELIAFGLLARNEWPLEDSASHWEVV